MTSSLLTIAVFLVLLALLPVTIRWLRRNSAAGQSASAAAMHMVSAMAVGPHQKVMTVEVGPEGARVWLVLGVSGQNMTCLHSMVIPPSSVLASGTAVESTSVLS